MINPFKVSPVFEWNLAASESIVINQGGTSAGKTFSLLQVLLVKAMQKNNLVCTVAGQDMPNLRAGAVRELDKVLQIPFFGRMLKKINRNECIYYLNNGSFIEFKSYDNEQDARNGKRDFLFINEANGLSFEIFEQLQVRTEYQTFIDYNPSAPFWVHSQLLGKAEVVRFISNYQHNGHINDKGVFVSNLSYRKIKNIEVKKDRPEWWRVYGLGYTGKVSDVVFPNINWLSEIPQPEDCQRTAYGLDFGYTNDPTALIRLSLYRGELYAEGLLYETGLKYNEIGEFMAEHTNTALYDCISDNDPRAIDTLKDYGVYCQAADKRAGSIIQGIEIIKQYKLNILNNLDWKDEQLSYIYKKDRATGKPSKNTPIDKYNHYFDALRYAVQAINEQRNSGILATSY